MNRKAELTLMGVLTGPSSGCCYSNRKCRFRPDQWWRMDFIRNMLWLCWSGSFSCLNLLLYLVGGDLFFLEKCASDCGWFHWGCIRVVRLWMHLRCVCSHKSFSSHLVYINRQAYLSNYLLKSNNVQKKLLKGEFWLKLFLFLLMALANKVSSII